MSVHNHLGGFGGLNSGFWVARNNNTRSDLLGAAFHRGQTMLVQTSQGQSSFAHVVVLGNEKGGSGKSSAALHVAVALLKAGQRVATIDLDGRQQSLTSQPTDRALARACLWKPAIVTGDGETWPLVLKSVQSSITNTPQG